MHACLRVCVCMCVRASERNDKPVLNLLAFKKRLTIWFGTEKCALKMHATLCTYSLIINV